MCIFLNSLIAFHSPQTVWSLPSFTVIRVCLLSYIERGSCLVAGLVPFWSLAFFEAVQAAIYTRIITVTFLANRFCEHYDLVVLQCFSLCLVV